MYVPVLTPATAAGEAAVETAMVVDVLGHATDSLDYLRLLTKQSIFCFCAIPQTMAMATLSLCFMNYDMFQNHIKIRRAEAASVRHHFPTWPFYH